MSSYKVIIVGAGLSGFAAAAKLIENGVSQIAILEAEDRIGGRVHSIPFSDGFIDLGAEFCHGEKNNAIYEMVHEQFEFGGSNELVSDYILSSGESANHEICSKLDALLARLYQKSWGLKNDSIGSIVQREYEKALNTPEYADIDKSLARSMLFRNRNHVSLCYSADSWTNISDAYYKYGQKCDGNQMLTWKTEGFKTVFDFISVSDNVR